jgi:hypothetical protein
MAPNIIKFLKAINKFEICHIVLSGEQAVYFFIGYHI